MKKKTILNILVLLTLTSGYIQAQEVRRCASQEVLARQELQDPSIKNRAQQFEAQMQEYLSAQEQSKAFRIGNTDTATTYMTILVVVHVVYNTTAENISDQQIQSQLVITNKDYHRLNSDTTLTPAPFKLLAGKTNFMFKLAIVDANGNPTNGIVRKQTTATSFTDDDGVKKPSQGGDTAWPSSKYLNIWVCNLSGNFLGYTQFPFVNQPATDGVVVHYKAVGNIGTASRPYHLGRTVTHEIGHWLNLYHIWGDAVCGDDQVADTPTQYTDHNGQSPSFPSISSAPCANAPNGDMYMDYLDYTNDSCMNMFSEGQVQRMVAAITQYPDRVALTQNAYQVTGIATLQGNNSFKLIPNPSNGHFKAVFLSNTAKTSLCIYDVLGKKVYENNLPESPANNELSLDLNLCKGVYIVSGEMNHQTFTQKLVIQ